MPSNWHHTICSSGLRSTYDDGAKSGSAAIGIEVELSTDREDIAMGNEVMRLEMGVIRVTECAGWTEAEFRELISESAWELTQAWMDLGGIQARKADLAEDEFERRADYAERAYRMNGAWL